MDMNLLRETGNWSDMKTDRDIDRWIFDMNSGMNYGRMKIEANSGMDICIQSGRYPAEIPAMNVGPILEIENVEATNIAIDSNMLSGLDSGMDRYTKHLNMPIVLLD